MTVTQYIANTFDIYMRVGEAVECVKCGRYVEETKAMQHMEDCSDEAGTERGQE